MTDYTYVLVLPWPGILAMNRSMWQVTVMVISSTPREIP